MSLFSSPDYNRFAASTEDLVLPIRLCFRLFLSRAPCDMSPQLRSLVYDPYDVKITLRKKAPAPVSPLTRASFSPTSSTFSPSKNTNTTILEEAEPQTAASVLLDIAEILETQYRLPHPYSDPDNWVFWGPTKFPPGTPNLPEKSLSLGVKEVSGKWPFIPLYRCAKPDGMWVLDAQVSCKLGPPRFEDVVSWQYGSGGLKEGKKGVVDLSCVVEYKEMVEREKQRFGFGSRNPYLIGGSVSYRGKKYDRGSGSGEPMV